MPALPESLRHVQDRLAQHKVNGAVKKQGLSINHETYSARRLASAGLLARSRDGVVSASSASPMQP